MSFWGDVLRVGGTVGGGVGGFALGGPGGALAGAGLGGSLGNTAAGMIDDSGDEEAQRQRALWEAALQEATSPTGDRKLAIEQLKRMTTSGALPEEKLRLMEAAIGANQIANSREQALLADQQMRGGGRSQGGQTVALQAQAAQMGGNRYALQAAQSDAQASQRQQQAIQAFNAEMDRAMQMRLAATGGLTGAYANQQDLSERRNEAKTQNVAGVANNLVGAGTWLYNRQSPVAQPGMKAPSGADLNFRGGSEPLRGPTPTAPILNRDPGFQFTGMSRPDYFGTQGQLQPRDPYFDPFRYAQASSGPSYTY